MKKEKSYTIETDISHIKKLGQYFTNYKIASFMCNWVCEKSPNLLDPAVGNSIFFLEAKKKNPHCKFTGYEIDNHILSYFGNPTDADIREKDYLLSDWDEKYSAIVCNPPYNRFQVIENRSQILEIFYKHTKIKYSGYTNQYILFLIKSIYQLAPGGRLAYIIPSEFLNSKYGESIKELLLKEKIVHSIINFENNDEMFFNATTTCCILLLSKNNNKVIQFFNLKSIDDIETLNINNNNKAITIDYDKITHNKKWRKYINHEEESIEYKNLINVSSICKVQRGIATGANKYFCFTLSKAQEENIPLEYLSKCICKSADIKNLIFSENEFNKLSKNNKTVYILDVKDRDITQIIKYIKHGEEIGINKKYLPSHRKSWYTMENKPIAPIWVTSANRNSIKFIRNITNSNSLTTFHSIYIHEEYTHLTDIIFCYFLTPIAQNILRDNRKELGNGLEKFQPNDLNNAKMINIANLSRNDINKINQIYQEIMDYSDSDHKEQIAKLNNIFSNYII